jgi:LVIVD repeat
MRSRATILAAFLLAATAGAQADPRVGLKGGWKNAGEAAENLKLIAHRDRPEGFYNADSAGLFGLINADMAFKGNYAYVGGFHGFQVWDISNPASPTLRKAYVCPGGQGDLSVYRNLLFMSVEETRARVDCGGQGVADTVSAERFRGVRIFDISNIDSPKQVAAVQTCRGSHTHTLVLDPRDPANAYIYVSGTGVARSPSELAGCSGAPPSQDTATSLFRIDIIRVPLNAPQNARIVNSPRVFADSTGAIAGLLKGDALDPTHTHAETNRCHDITVYSAIGLAAGACAGNGILLDIRDPVHPKRVAEVSDPNFSFWHSATFSNSGKTVLFSDEWGGGMAPKCRATDNPQWGADAIYTLSGHRLTPAGYFKMPAAQTDLENCVAHNGSLIPVPGRDIMTQAWYQGGVSVFDFTDPAHPKEIAFFDRGPMDTTLVLSGYWSTYWYNGHIYGSEIGRGLDVFDLLPSDYLSKNEIAAAKLVHFETFNPQNQPRMTWPVSLTVAHAYLDQIVRGDATNQTRLLHLGRSLDRIQAMPKAQQAEALDELIPEVEADERLATDVTRLKMIADILDQMAKSRR